MLQGYYIAKSTENILVTALSFCANYIKQAAHLCFGNNVTCYMSAIFIVPHFSRINFAIIMKDLYLKKRRKK